MADSSEPATTASPDETADPTTSAPPRESSELLDAVQERIDKAHDSAGAALDNVTTPAPEPATTPDAEIEP